MNERILSELQKEYRSFFLEKMSLYGVKSPAELTKENKSEFFTEIKQDWTKYKLNKKEKQITVTKPAEVYNDKLNQDSDIKLFSTKTEKQIKRILAIQIKKTNNSTQGKKQHARMMNYQR